MEQLVTLCDFEHVEPYLAVASCDRCHKDGCRLHVSSLDVSLNWDSSRHFLANPTGQTICRQCFNELEFTVTSRQREAVPSS